MRHKDRYYCHILNKGIEFVQLNSVRALWKSHIGIWETIALDRARRRFQPTSANSCWVAGWLGLAWCEECVPCNFRDNSVDLKRFVPTSFWEPWVHNVCIHLLPPKLGKGKNQRRKCWLDFSLQIVGPSSVLLIKHRPWNVCRSSINGVRKIMSSITLLDLNEICIPLVLCM